MEAILDGSGVVEMFVKGVNILQNASLSANDEIINRDDMLAEFGKSDAANVLMKSGWHLCESNKHLPGELGCQTWLPVGGRQGLR